jgi:sugar/nucleoside kinase (ribokinase family)
MKKYQAVGIGNAVSDVISQASDAFLGDMGIEKGIMQLVDRDRAEALFAAMNSRTETPGGSVANTLAGLGLLGVKCAFIGRVADDDVGTRYAETLTAEGTDFPNAPISGATLPSSRSMIFVSPDGERSMNTYLGISTDVGPEDVSPEVVENCEILFLEGYLFDKAPGKAAFRKAADLARNAGAQAGITLSDPFCVDRHRDDFRALVAGPLDFFTANEEELLSLYQVTDLNAALDAAAQECRLVVCTRSGDGVSIRQGQTHVDVPVQQVVPVDATGAGDQFAAGFIYGLIQGKDLESCGRIGCAMAGEVISHIGPRPEANVQKMLQNQGLL